MTNFTNLLRSRAITFSMVVIAILLLAIPKISIATTDTLYSLADAYTHEGFPTTNFNSDTVTIGRDNDGSAMEALIWFNISSWNSISLSSIQKAELVLYRTMYIGTVDAWVWQAWPNWGEDTVTFNSNIAGANKSTNFVPTSGSSNDIVIDVTSHVKSWLEGTWDNFGFAISDRNTPLAGSFVTFASHEWSFQSQRPKLILTYTESVTLDSITISGTASVDENSGTQYYCYANYDDGSGVSCTGSATWSETCPSTTINTSSGYLTTGEVSADQSCSVTASFGGESASKSITILDLTPPCSLDSSSASFDSSGGNGTITTNNDCISSSSDASEYAWLHVTRIFTEYVSYVVDTNTSASSRTGTIVINGNLTYTVTQSGVPPTNGVCGSSDGQTFTSAPSGSGLCNTGSDTGVTTNTGSYTWSCSGSNGGTNASCSATRAYTVTPSAGSGGSISPNTPQTVAYNQTKQFTVTPDSGYTATVEGTCGGSPSSGTSQFTYTTNAITGNCTVSVTFTQAPDITVTPTTIPFGNVNIDSNSDKTVTVINDGTLSFNIETVTDPSSPFSIVSDNCSGTSLSPSASCTMTIRFSPTTLDDFNSTFDIPSDDPDENPVTIALTGTGGWFGDPDIDVSDRDLGFLNIEPGVDADQTVTVTNLGDGYLNITSITSLSAPFSIVSGEDNCSQTSVTPNESCTVKIRFNSATSGTFDSSFSISSDDPDENLVDVGLLGSATPPDNDHPTNPSPVSPANGATNMPTTVTFKWSKCSDANGDPLAYKLYYSTDPSFTGTTPVQVAALKNGEIYAWASTGFLFFGVVFSGGIRSRKKIALMLLMTLMIVALSISCGGGGGGGSGGGSSTPAVSSDITQTVSGLSSGTTYYWKVVADDGNGGLTESGTQSFTTQ